MASVLTRVRRVAAALCVVLTLGAGAPGGLGAPPSAGTLALVASMSVRRAAHTATTLTDGRVLVAGGFAEKGNAADAEIYEPDGGRFVALPRMVAARQSHTATLLPDGRVLLAGGYGNGTALLASAEIFDPKTNSFAPTGPLLEARANHTAVLLESGKVLLIGGAGPDWTTRSSAELYDPATGRFARAGAMSVAREGHIAVRLADGRVLVAGGHHGRRATRTVLASAEIYDPGTGAFRRVGDMRARRHKHDAVLLPDGQVLILAGSNERDDRGLYDSTERFDPRTETFAAGPTMKLPRHKLLGSSVLLPSGLVLVAGGAGRAEVYDPRAGTFTLVAGESAMAGNFSAVAKLKNGSVLITGGYGNGTGARSSAWLYRS